MGAEADRPGPTPARSPVRTARPRPSPLQRQLSALVIVSCRSRRRGGAVHPDGGHEVPRISRHTAACACVRAGGTQRLSSMRDDCRPTRCASRASAQVVARADTVWRMRLSARAFVRDRGARGAALESCRPIRGSIGTVDRGEATRIGAKRAPRSLAGRCARMAEGTAELRGTLEGTPRAGGRRPGARRRAHERKSDRAARRSRDGARDS